VVTTNLRLQINLDPEHIGTISIFDLHGRELLQVKGKSGSQNLSVSTLPSGKYLVRFLTKSNQVYTGQFIKD
jgi:hypothetical protein